MIDHPPTEFPATRGRVQGPCWSEASALWEARSNSFEAAAQSKVALSIRANREGSAFKVAHSSYAVSQLQAILLFHVSERVRVQRECHFVSTYRLIGNSAPLIVCLDDTTMIGDWVNLNQLPGANYFVARFMAYDDERSFFVCV
ncbi:hypothetical protein [Bradyrhizobium sp. WSM1743]|uniref:hypothetical protein n=1 Tax=Bradyrhizobium sp. WSM1743 TaxID=318996 RepID=UPI0012EB13AE|nr:hypothetical protein [Bradyrhizobium sp. WSM1743]